MTVTFEDQSILAVLLYLRTYLNFNLEINFKRNPLGRVFGEVSGDVESALQFLADNQPVPVKDFISCWRSVKSQIFSLKGAGTGGYRRG